jgi:hypothetical protein
MRGAIIPLPNTPSVKAQGQFYLYVNTSVGIQYDIMSNIYVCKFDLQKSET